MNEKPAQISFRMALREIMREKGITNETMAERMGVHPVTVSKLLNDRMRMTESWADRMAQALSMTADQVRARFAQPPAQAPDSTSRELPVHGLAAGSISGALTMSEEPFEYVACPPGLLRVRDAYALVVSGASMEPKFTTGDLIFIHPHRPVRPDDYVIIQELRDRAVATSIKQFKKVTADHIITVQFNPAAEVKFSRKSVTHMHRVLTTNELFGL